ncbi:universal stress protein [Nocardia sp. NPDC058176]|uniref:universal stress protein n=1 Tax=Nocardia sp. NPDC058176 TaxID=3346368 RepID=UPI0036D86F9C
MTIPGDPKQPVVVGVDGSEPSRRALYWAAYYAAHHRVPLRVVHAAEFPLDYGPGLTGPVYDLEALRRHGEAVVSAAAAEAGELTAPIADIVIATDAVAGPAVQVLRDHSESARLVVVGSRGLGAIRRTLLGSVSTSLARHALCPVAVVPESTTPLGAAVVVGVDGSPCSVDAVAIAFDEAARRGARLVAVHAWSGSYRNEAHATMQAEAEAVLAESLAGYAEKYPEVAVERIVVEERPARAVLAAGADAQLIVVGSHGRGGFAEMTLGSVAQAVLHGATCPLIIARPGVGH